MLVLGLEMSLRTAQKSLALALAMKAKSLALVLGLEISRLRTISSWEF